jgi:hypothetical protein
MKKLYDQIPVGTLVTSAETQLGVWHVFQTFVILQCSDLDGAIGFRTKRRQQLSTAQSQGELRRISG